MDLKNFKLQLINQIMQTDDLVLLQTIQQILSLNNGKDATKQQIMSQQLPFESSSIPVEKELDAATQELQDSIDEIFNP